MKSTTFASTGTTTSSKNALCLILDCVTSPAVLQREPLLAEVGMELLYRALCDGALGPVAHGYLHTAVGHMGGSERALALVAHATGRPDITVVSDVPDEHLYALYLPLFGPILVQLFTLVRVRVAHVLRKRKEAHAES